MCYLPSRDRSSACFGSTIAHVLIERVLIIDGLPAYVLADMLLPTQATCMCFDGKCAAVCSSSNYAQSITSKHVVGTFLAAF